MRKFLSITILVLFVCVAFNTAAKAPMGTPTRAIQDLDDKLDDYKTGPNLSEADKQFNKDLKKDILHGTFDVNELARLALEKHWLPRTYKERTGFVDLMTELLENKAILSKEQGQKKAKTQRVYNIRYLGDKFLNSKKSRAAARTSVYVKSEDITVKLDYKLRMRKGEWMVYDVILDGASLVDNYRYQFDRIITKHNYAELISRMEKKLNELTVEKNEPA
jgi:phospholipid transport system substrate-binding protein